MGVTVQFVKLFKRKRSAVPSLPSAPPPSEPAPQSARASYIDTVIRKEVVDVVDETTAARDDRAIDEEQRRRFSDLAETVVGNAWQGPPAKTGADAALVA